MKNILSVENMRLSDAHTIESGVPGKELMMRAARGIFEAVDWKGPVAIVCGSGNNAGDGYALALLLKGAGFPVTLIRLGQRFSEDGRYYYDKCRKEGIEDRTWNEETDFGAFATVVDAILGTGFAGKVREDIAAVIDKINSSGAYIVSADINSGLNGDTGMAGKGGQDDICVISDICVSIGGYKPGHFLNMAKDVMRSKVNVDIGIEPLSEEGLYSLIEEEDLSGIIPVRPNFSNKGTYGYTALIGGSLRYSGAIRLASMAGAAMRSGAGVVKIGVPSSLAKELMPHILESTLFPMQDSEGEFVFNEDELKELTSNVKTVAFGMGIGVRDETAKMLEYLLKNYKGRLIIDADGLTILSGMSREAVANAGCDLVLTPHIKEFSRLTGKTIEEILENPMGSAINYAKELTVGPKRVLLLKGPSTIITDGRKTYITDSGCPGMATAGSGDVLSGILSATCAYIPDLTPAVAAGAYINGRAGELAQQEMGPVSMIAGDTVSFIPEVIKT
ncbi:MAG: NAD(P)H-hydrate dehydratase [Lachnospiraceae bacterium]|nr:NAD(P)H-hydrate dehydratase [Lachnospiraceae bacterium]